MIPHSWIYTLTCDRCGAHRNLLICSERIDELSIDGALQEAAEGDGWAVVYPQTFCADCVRQVLNQALTQLAEEAAHKALKSSESAVSEAAPGAVAEGAA